MDETALFLLLYYSNCHYRGSREVWLLYRKGEFKWQNVSSDKGIRKLALFHPNLRDVLQQKDAAS